MQWLAGAWDEPESPGRPAIAALSASARAGRRQNAERSGVEDSRIGTWGFEKVEALCVLLYQTGEIPRPGVRRFASKLFHNGPFY